VLRRPLSGEKTKVREIVWRESVSLGQAAAARHVPAGLTASIAVVGTPLECRERVEACRRSGIALPIVNPRPTGTDPKQTAIEVLQACTL